MTAYQRKLIWKKNSPEKFKAGRARMQRNVRARVAAWLRKYKINHPCICGEKDPACLDFHHRNPLEKSFALCNDRGFALNRIKIEATKCEVICANDHRRGHAGRPRLEHAAFFPPAGL